MDVVGTTVVCQEGAGSVSDSRVGLDLFEEGRRVLEIFFDFFGISRFEELFEIAEPTEEDERVMCDEMG